MTSRRAWIAGLAGMALAAPAAVAQDAAGLGGAAAAAPGAASSVAAAGSGLGGGGSAVAVAGAAQPTTLWSFFGLSASNLAACRAKFCASQLGLMANSLVTGPVGKVSGGFIPPLCPPAPSAAAIANMPGGPQGAEATAGKIKASEADAKARVAAVEYLGTVDCTHWPEASKALQNALRADPNECVRLAAAVALNSGCCCSKEIIDSLSISVAGTGADGNPPENSPRVKASAFAALQNCLMRVPPTPATEEPGPEPLELKPEPSTLPPPIPNPPVTPERSTTTTNRSSGPTHVTAANYQYASRALTYQEQLRRKSFAQTVDDARRTLVQASQRSAQSNALPPGKQSVLHALIKARENLDSRPSPRPTYPLATAPTDPGVNQSSYAKPTATVTAARSVNPRLEANDAAARPIPPMSVATSISPNAELNTRVVPRIAPALDPAPQIDVKPVPMEVGELNTENEPPAEVPSVSPEPPQRSYQGGLIQILIRRARKQAEQ